MDITSLIKPELLILVPVMYIIGIAVKSSSISNKFIPLILGIVSICLTAIYVFSVTPIDSVSTALSSVFCVLCQGVLIAGTAVYADQLKKQLITNKGE